MNRLFDRLVTTDVGDGEKMGLSFIPAAEILLIPSTAQVMAFCQRGSPVITVS